jgi:hypothetical protein
MKFQDVEKALDYLKDTDEAHAKAKALVKALEHGFKTIKAEEYLNATGTNGEREQRAYASTAYKELTNRYAQAVIDFELMENKRERAALTIDVWRSLNANQRKGNI